MYLRRVYRGLPALLLGTALLVAGCGSSATGQTAEPTATNIPTPLPTATLQPMHLPVPPDCTPVAPGAFPTGSYNAAHDDTKNIVFQANGQLIHPSDTKGQTTDCYIVVHQHLLINQPTGTCGDTDTDYGDYTWSFDGTTLRFIVVNDHCPEREAFMTGAQRSWIKQAGT